MMDGRFYHQDGCLFCEEIDLALATGCINCINVVHEMRYGQYYHHLYNRSPSRDHVMNAKLMLDFTTNNNFARPDIHPAACCVVDRVYHSLKP
jgi:hypothetical protein